MIESVRIFEEHLWEAGIIDPVGVHSEFSQTPGLHGQKVEFDKIKTGSSLFDEWIEVTAEAIDRHYDVPERPSVLIAVANGTNRIIEPIAEKLGRGMVGLVTKKEKGIVMLTPESYRRVKGRKPGLALVIDDVGTTGRNSRHAVYYTKKAGAQDAKVLYTWQRQADLPELSSRGIVHSSIIKKILPTFTPDDCKDKTEGYCAKGWELIPYNRNNG